MGEPDSYGNLGEPLIKIIQRFFWLEGVGESARHDHVQERSVNVYQYCVYFLVIQRQNQLPVEDFKMPVSFCLRVLRVELLHILLVGCRILALILGEAKRQNIVQQFFQIQMAPKIGFPKSKSHGLWSSFPFNSPIYTCFDSSVATEPNDWSPKTGPLGRWGWSKQKIGERPLRTGSVISPQ